ncbi:MAG: hypothetical protein JWP89_2022 [Schlesneria sp.]|nr:hypothetical protein [Schlesneria sp.]
MLFSGRKQHRVSLDWHADISPLSARAFRSRDLNCFRHRQNLSARKSGNLGSKRTSVHRPARVRGWIFDIMPLHVALVPIPYF